MNMSDIIHAAQKNECSDIHLTVGKGVTCRQYGKLKKMKLTVSDQELEDIILDMCNDAQREEFEKGKKETPHIPPPPRILLSGIHLG